MQNPKAGAGGEPHVKRRGRSREGAKGAKDSDLSGRGGQGGLGGQDSDARGSRERQDLTQERKGFKGKGNSSSSRLSR
jgi:hypothetical protein